MSRTFKATAINLKALPMGESDRLLTLLTPELGMLRVVAPGARKHLSRLGGRSGLFVINDVLVAKGKQLDKLVQAETLKSFPKLSQHLGKLTASQYLAEMVLLQALSDHPQPELYHLFVEHLERIETSSDSNVLACLAHGIYHLLALEGVAPEVQACCVTRHPIVPNLGDPAWRIGFSAVAGGIFQLSELGQLASNAAVNTGPQLATNAGLGRAAAAWPVGERALPVVQLTALELALLQQLSKPELVATASLWDGSGASLGRQPHDLWLRIERLLRQYAQYHFDRPIRSAALIDACFTGATYGAAAL